MFFYSIVNIRLIAEVGLPLTVAMFVSVWICDSAAYIFGKQFGNKKIELMEEARIHLAKIASGDARAALNALELAVLTSQASSDEKLRITLNIYHQKF